MKNRMFILTILIISMIAISACAQQPAQPQPVASTAVDGGPVVTSAPGQLGGPISQITPDAPTPTPSDGATLVTIGLNNQGGKVNVAMGQSILLMLGEQYTWDINLSDQGIISRVKNIAVLRGAQGIYETIKPGTVLLTATGDPLCRQSKPACGQPSIQFEVTIIVK
jgi:hypothetical protein